VLVVGLSPDPSGLFQTPDGVGDPARFGAGGGGQLAHAQALLRSAFQLDHQFEIADRHAALVADLLLQSLLNAFRRIGARFPYPAVLAAVQGTADLLGLGGDLAGSALGPIRRAVRGEVALGSAGPDPQRGHGGAQLFAAAGEAIGDAAGP